MSILGFILSLCYTPFDEVDNTKNEHRIMRELRQEIPLWGVQVHDVHGETNFIVTVVSDELAIPAYASKPETFVRRVAEAEGLPLLGEELRKTNVEYFGIAYRTDEHGDFPQGTAKYEYPSLCVGRRFLSEILIDRRIRKMPLDKEIQSLADEITLVRDKVKSHRESIVRFLKRNNTSKR